MKHINLNKLFYWFIAADLVMIIGTALWFHAQGRF